MTTLPQRRLTPKRLVTLLLPLAAAASGLAVALNPLHAAPRQNDFEIQAVSMVDIFGGTDLNCPGCDGIYGPDDEQAALDPATALGAMKFVVKDAQGNEITSNTTTSIGGLQSVLLVVPELLQGDSYTLELDAPPAGWVLCSLDNAKRTLTVDDFQAGSARAEFHFTLVCNNAATPTPTPAGEMTPAPATAAAPTAKPSSGGGDKAPQLLGAVKGIVFADLNHDGKLGADEPGVNDVRVVLHGGGVELAQITKASGTFSFEALGTGDYDVSISPGAEWTVTTASSYHVHVAGKDAIGNDFGLARGKAKTASTAAAPRLPRTGLSDTPLGLLLLGSALALAVLGTGGLIIERRMR